MPSSNPEPQSPRSPGSLVPNVAKAGGIMMASLLLSRVLGLVRDMVMAGMFGADRATDAYRLAFQIPDLMFFLIAGGALSSAFIPVFSEYLHTEREREAWHIFSVVVTVMSIVVIVFIVAAWIFAMPLAHLVAWGKPPEDLELIVAMSRILLPAQYAFLIGGLMFGTLYARQVFTVPGLGPNIYNIGIIFGAVVISHFMLVPVMGMTWGAVIGATIGNLVIPFLFIRKVGGHFSPSLDVKHPGAKKVFKLMLPVVLGLSLPAVYGMIMQAFATLYEPGINTNIYNANVLMQAPLGIFGQSLAIAVFPALTQFFAQKKMDMFRAQMSTTIRTVLYITIPVSVFIGVAATPIVTTIFEHGKFTHENTLIVAACLRLFSIGIAAWCLHPVLMRGFFATQNTVTPVVLGSMTTVLFVALCLVLRQTTLSYLALPLAGSISAVTLVIFMAVALRSKIDGLDFRGIFITLGKSMLASAAFALVTAAVLFTPLGEMSSTNKIAALGILLLLALPGMSAYVWLTRKMGMPETAYFDRAISRIKNRGKLNPTVSAQTDAQISHDEEQS